jgi:hypothetical protein
VHAPIRPDQLVLTPEVIFVRGWSEETAGRIFAVDGENPFNEWGFLERIAAH